MAPSFAEPQTSTPDIVVDSCGYSAGPRQGGEEVLGSDSTHAAPPQEVEGPRREVGAEVSELSMEAEEDSEGKPSKGHWPGTTRLGGGLSLAGGGVSRRGDVLLCAGAAGAGGLPAGAGGGDRWDAGHAAATRGGAEEPAAAVMAGHAPWQATPSERPCTPEGHTPLGHRQEVERGDFPTFSQPNLKELT